MISDNLRATLKSSDDGMTVAELGEQLSLRRCDLNRVYVALDRMVDAYIDRYQIGQRGQFEAVWMVVDVPENAPKLTARQTA